MPETDAPSADDADTMHIGEVAARTELSLRSLRHWEEVGLVRPSGRSEGGFRLYTESDVDRILAIRRMKPLGFTLDQMAAAMRDIETLADEEVGEEERTLAQQRLVAVLADAGRRRTDLRTQLAMADEFIDGLQSRIDRPGA